MWNRLKPAGLKSRRVIKRPILSDRHQWLRLAWCLARRDLNLTTWRSIHWSDESLFLFHVTDGRMRIWRQKNTYTHRSINPTVPYSGGSVMYGVYLSWLQVGLGHHTRKPNRWSVHQRCLTTSCWSPFRQPPTSYQIWVYWWQHHAASFKGSNRLPSKCSRNFSPITSHEPGSESDRACLGHARPSCTGSWTSYTKLTSIGSSIASRMAVATTAAHSTTGGETEGWGRHPSTWWFHSILNFEPWMSIDVFQVKWQSYRAL